MISMRHVPHVVVDRSALPPGVDVVVQVDLMLCTALALADMERALAEHNERESEVRHALPFRGFRAACPTLRFEGPA